MVVIHKRMTVFNLLQPVNMLRRNFHHLLHVSGIFNDRNTFQKWWCFFFVFFYSLLVQESKLLRLSIHILDLRESGAGCVCLLLGDYPSLCFVPFFPDIPSTTTVPPLTPGTTQKMSQAVHESFKTFEREQQKFHISNGKPEASSDYLSFMCRSCRY